MVMAMSRSMSILDFINDGHEPSVKYSVKVHFVTESTGDYQHVYVWHFFEPPNRMVIRVHADSVIVFEIRTNKPIHPKFDTYNGNDTWIKLIGLLIVHVHKLHGDVHDGVVTYINRDFYDKRTNVWVLWFYEIRFREPNREMVLKLRDTIVSFLRSQLGLGGGYA